ncbi:MAG: NUDIX domain-containing protein [Alphaproteobacteria bacterium]|nr:NUDIX domain-containing protein [Alphaproteobacteria bacterium]
MQPVMPRPAAIAVVRREGRFLLVRRGQPPDPGRWGFPGGKIEPGETAAEAAVRELAEETGVVAQALRAFDCVDVIRRNADGSLAYHFVLTAVACRWISGEAVAADDAHEAAWFTLAEISAGKAPFLEQVERVARSAPLP